MDVITPPAAKSAQAKVDPEELFSGQLRDCFRTGLRKGTPRELFLAVTTMLRNSAWKRL